MLALPAPLPSQAWGSCSGIPLMDSEFALSGGCRSRAVLAVVLQCPGSEDTRFHTCLMSVPSLLQLPWVTLLPVSGAA